MELLAAALLSCSDGKWILDGIADVELERKYKIEIIVEVLKDMPDDCKSSDYKPEGRR